MDLARLIEANKRGRSYRKLADDCGGKPTHQRLQQLGSGAVKEWMEPDNISGLARGLSVTERAVVLALAESMGLSVGSHEMLEMHLPSNTDRLRPDQLAALGALVRSMLPTTQEDETDANADANEKMLGGSPRPTSQGDDATADNVRHIGRTPTAAQRRTAARPSDRAGGPALKPTYDALDAAGEHPDAEGPEEGA